MEAGHSEVLVLDDQLVEAGEAGEDALVSLERRDIEVAERRIAAKRKRLQSNPYDDEINQPLRMGKSLLRKYDEEDDENEKVCNIFSQTNNL
jgi:hypothetical protein